MNYCRVKNIPAEACKLEIVDCDDICSDVFDVIYCNETEIIAGSDVAVVVGDVVCGEIEVIVRGDIAELVADGVCGDSEVVA